MVQSNNNDKTDLSCLAVLSAVSFNIRSVTIMGSSLNWHKREKAKLNDLYFDHLTFFPGPTSSVNSVFTPK